MILDAFLMSAARLSEKSRDHSLAIFPHAKLAAGDGLKFKNLDTDYALWLAGNADYLVIQYEKSEISTGNPRVLF